VIILATAIGAKSLLQVQVPRENWIVERERRQW
jgi:hypothetical protein